MHRRMLKSGASPDGDKMAKLLVNGKWEKIPPFPHHKEYIYRCRQFFFARTTWGQMRLGNGLALRETWRGMKNRTMIPRDLMIDPTSRCNLRCKGCWAADYDGHEELSYAKLDEIISQAEDLGIPDCLMTGGEPLLRRADILRLCAEHRKTTFGVFTNATLVDEALADEMARLENLNLFISIEGWREQTDSRRGQGVFASAVKAMEILHSRGIGFGFSICYHQKNYLEISSDEFLDFLRGKGAWFGWLFQYIPKGRDADLSYVLTPEQRLSARDRINAYSRKNDIVLIDFWNNGHLSYGCIGGGSGYLHINAQGDVEPCAFCHYADCNIKEVDLKTALQSDFLRSFRQAQPFSDNSLNCCPVIDHAEKLAELVAASGARSTHLGQGEPVEELVMKTKATARNWQIAARAGFAGLTGQQKKNFRNYLRFHKFKKRVCDRLP